METETQTGPEQTPEQQAKAQRIRESLAIVEQQTKPRLVDGLKYAGDGFIEITERSVMIRASEIDEVKVSSPYVRLHMRSGIIHEFIIESTSAMPQHVWECVRNHIVGLIGLPDSEVTQISKAFLQA